MPIAITGVLGKEREKRGYRLIEPDDHFVWLFFWDSLIATFTQNVTPIELRREADKDWERRQA